MGAKIEAGENWHMNGQKINDGTEASKGQLISLEGESTVIIFPFKKFATWVGIKRGLGMVNVEGKVMVKPEGCILYGSKGAIEFQQPGSPSYLKVANK